MKEEQNKKRNLVFLIAGVLTLLIVVVGATYAFFQAQIGTGKEINADVSTGTTDNLTFSMSDINRNVEPNKEDNVLDEENAKTDIVINANQKNFGPSNISLGDGVSAKALLKANNTTNEATQYYNVFFVLEEPISRLVYTIDEEHPELILTVIDPDDEEVTEIDGLIYHTADPENPNDVSGFDITGRVDSFAIKRKQEIKVEKTNNDHQTEQEWKIKVTLINFPENDQKNNTGKEIKGNVIITTEDDENAYKLAHVSSIDTSSTVDSITTTMEYEPGNKGIAKYYFGIEEVGEVSPISLEDVKVWEEDEDATHTFTGLKDNYNYRIYCYIEDTEGIKSNIYGTEVEKIVATEKLPKVNKINVTSKSYNEINISVDAEAGTNGISNYEYTIKGATIEGGTNTEETTLSTHTFDGLSELQDYTIEVRVKDNKGNYSVVSTKTISTAQIYRYNYIDNIAETGESYAFVSPATGTYKIELWGAQGGNLATGVESYLTGGNGGYSVGNILLHKDDVLYIYVGENGIANGNVTFNGGGASAAYDGNCASGGGATDVRLDNGNWDEFNSLKSRIMVAGGGAGGERHYVAGVGGGLKSTSSYDDNNIATQATGYKFGVGMNGIGGTNYSGSGGGYYGGKSTLKVMHGSAGGSGFISGYKGCVAIKQESTVDNIQPLDNCTDGTEDVTCSYHYSGKIFTEPNMIAGNAEMPNHEGTGVMIGNEGNGYAKITPISIVDE